MLRTASLTTFLLLGATLLAPGVSATAVGETCRGEAATIVDTGSSTFPILRGTEGRDVIVIANVGQVHAYGGNDLICVTGRVIKSLVEVDAGAGDDVVDTAAVDSGQTIVRLGAGADVFAGGDGDDSVNTAGLSIGSGAPVVDTEVDHVETGGGDDFVESVHEGPDPDVVLTGDGDDTVHATGPLAAGGRLDGGDGQDEVRTSVSSGRLVVDIPRGTAELDGLLWMRWLGFEDVGLEVKDVDLTLTGSKGPNSLAISVYDGESQVKADLGASDDQLSLTAYATDIAIGVFTAIDVDGGPGSDLVEPLGLVDVAVDLGRDLLTWDSIVHSVEHFEDASAIGSTVRLIGDEGPNVLEGGPCTVRVSGRGGADELGRRGEPGDGLGNRCTGRGVRFMGGAGNDRLDGTGDADVLQGGRGNDRLIGRQGNDMLVGGSGRDKATGGPGRDSCSAETSRSCEQ